MIKTFNKLSFYLGLLLVGIGIVWWLGLQLFPSAKPLTIQKSTSIVANQQISYKGQKGKDALALLKAKTSVVQDKSGLVVSIGGRKANAGAHEYWAFSVNGKLAAVGPSAYITKDTDTIEWKIDHY